MIPELLPYAKMEPCSAQQLLKEANGVLKGLGLPGIQIRTLRFYISEGVVPPPIGSPKFARYEFRHLQNLVYARSLQNQGMKLVQIRSQLAPRIIVREHKAPYGDQTSIDLTPRVRLEIDASGNMEEDLRTAQGALKCIVDRIAKEQKWTSKAK